MILLSHWSSGRRPALFVRRTSALRMLARRSRNVRRLRRRRSRRLVARLSSSPERLPASCFRTTARNSSTTAAAMRNVVCSIMTSVHPRGDLCTEAMQGPGQVKFCKGVRFAGYQARKTNGCPHSHGGKNLCGYSDCPRPRAPLLGIVPAAARVAGSCNVHESRKYAFYIGAFLPENRCRVYSALEKDDP